MSDHAAADDDDYVEETTVRKRAAAGASAPSLASKKKAKVSFPAKTDLLFDNLQGGEVAKEAKALFTIVKRNVKKIGHHDRKKPKAEARQHGVVGRNLGNNDGWT